MSVIFNSQISQRIFCCCFKFISKKLAENENLDPPQIFSIGETHKERLSCFFES